MKVSFSVDYFLKLCCSLIYMYSIYIQYTSHIYCICMYIYVHIDNYIIQYKQQKTAAYIGAPITMTYSKPCRSKHCKKKKKKERLSLHNLSPALIRRCKSGDRSSTTCLLTARHIGQPLCHSSLKKI